MHNWDVSLEVADMYLERQARPMPSSGSTEAERLWAAKQKKEQFNAFDPPIEIVRTTMRRTATAVDSWRAATQDPLLPDDFDLADGLTVGIIAQVLTALMALLELGELAHASVRVPGTTLFHAHREQLAEWLTTVCEGMSLATADTALLRLTAGSKRSVRTSVLVPAGPGSVVTVLPLAMFPRAIDPIALRTAAVDQDRFGPIGMSLGKNAEVWKEWLSKIPQVKVAEGLKMRSPRGESRGDLDLLAVDLDTGKGIAFELKWPIDALTLNETQKINTIILKGCNQLAKYRHRLRSEEVTVNFPPRWPFFHEIEWTWVVGTPQQLYTAPLPEPEMFVTSFRYVKSLGSPASLEALINVLRNPDVPRLGQHYTVRRETIQLGRYVIDSDTIHALDMEWRPHWT
jgi:hypothetical protein